MVRALLCGWTLMPEDTEVEIHWTWRTSPRGSPFLSVAFLHDLSLGAFSSENCCAITRDNLSPPCFVYYDISQM